MNLRGWIAAFIVFASAIGLAYVLIPQKYADVAGVAGLVVFIACVRIANARSGAASVCPPRWTNSNALLWIGILLLPGAFVWLLIGFAIAGATGASPAIAFIPFAALAALGSALISIRIFGLLLANRYRTDC
jgi:hypothetical protein